MTLTKLIRTASAGVLITVALGMTGCNKEPEITETLRPVITYQVTAPQSTIIRSFSGTLSPAIGVELAFEVGGRLVRIQAKQGERFAAGSELARIDATEYQARFNESQSSLNQATQELRRIQRLFESGNASRSDLDAAVAREQSARSSFELAEKQLSDTVLTMPYDGLISRVNVEAQQVVSPGQSAIRVQGDGGIEFKFGVPSERVGELKVDLPVRVRIRDLGGDTFAATVTEISPTSDADTTFAVTADLLDPVPGMRDGMDGEAIIEFSNRDGAFTGIPLSSVSGSPTGTQFVWLVEANPGADEAALRQQDVKLGELLAEGKIAVLSGLEAGDQILARGAQSAREGMRVRLAN